MIKIIWVLVGINASALLIFFVLFIASTDGRNVDYQEKGWMTILFGLGLIVLLLAALPLKYGHSSFSVFIAGFFAALPLVIFLFTVISNNLPTFKKKQTKAEVYFAEKKQREIATAIEQSDTARLKELIKGENLNIAGNRVWDWDGLNYLQFAVRLRSKPVDTLFNDEASIGIIRLLVEKGSGTKGVLSEAIRSLPPAIIALLVDHGADPNSYGYTDNDPLLFEAIRPGAQQIDNGILLIQRGADVNAKAANNSGMTPMMVAANNARTSPLWNEAWRFVRYCLEEAKADYQYVTPDGISLQQIIKKVRQDAAAEKITMPADFDAIVQWLAKHRVDTAPVQQPAPVL